MLEEMVSGSSGDVVTAACRPGNRALFRGSAAHLLQAALRKVLGSHVEQAGQLVDSKRMRFDFSHFTAMTNDEIKQVENLVNGWILQGIQAEIREMPIDQAKKLGAIALFGEKYGDVVRVVRIGAEDDNVSIELCGGTHVDNTSKLGLFRIISEARLPPGFAGLKP